MSMLLISLLMNWYVNLLCGCLTQCFYQYVFASIIVLAYVPLLIPYCTEMQVAKA